MVARVLVSSCLLGEEVRYHGGSARIESPFLNRWKTQGRIVPLCPEVIAGLGTPRPAAELVGGDGASVLRSDAMVLRRDGQDVTQAFLAGAAHAVQVARELGIKVAVLKEGSPSCGTGFVYDGSFSGSRVGGVGVTAAALKEIGVRVFSESELHEADAVLEALDAGS